jgi:proteic killer suppression protein
MIKTFADKMTAAIFQGAYVRGVARELQHKARLRLQQIDAAVRLEDLRNPPSNRLARKKGKMQHLHCIRVNDQWRICFRWYNGGAYGVSFCDYH